jgi:hypothetical protein
VQRTLHYQPDIMSFGVKWLNIIHENFLGGQHLVPADIQHLLLALLAHAGSHLIMCGEAHSQHI